MPSHEAFSEVSRLHALTDGVFAIAMTLLVLELHVPDVTSTEAFIDGLGALVPSLFSFTLSFAVLGAYWLGTVWSLAPVRHVDRPLLLLNLLTLLFITLVPFTTAVLARYPDQPGAVILYGMHLTLLGLAQYASWSYLRANPRLLESPMTPSEAAARTRRILFGPVGFVAAMLVALVSPRAGYATFYIVLLAYIFTAARDRSIISR